MAFTRIGADWDRQSPSDTTLVYAATGTTLTAGNLVEGMVYWNGNTESCSSIVDNKGNSYTIARNITGAIYRGVSFYLPNILGGADPTFTITLSGAVTNRAFGFRQWSGGATSSILSNDIGQAQSAPATSANAITSTAVTPADNDCLVAGWSGGDLIAAAAGSGFSLDAGIGSPPGTFLAAEHLIQTTAASVAATFTDTTGALNLVTFMMAFKPPGAGGGVTDGWKILIH